MRRQSSPSAAKTPTWPVSSVDAENLAPAPESIRAVAQEGVKDLGVADGDDLAAADIEAEQRPVAIGPLLSGLVQALRPDLMGVADQR
jgi:hypothetical protein